MIKRIRAVENIGRFQALQSSQGNEGEFSKFNVLYAENGAGKSTICDILRALGSRDERFILGRKRIGSQSLPKVSVELDNGQIIEYSDSTWSNVASSPVVFVYDDRFVRENVFVDRQIDIDQRRNLYGLVLGQQAIALQNAIAVADVALTNARSTFTNAEAALRSLLPPSYDINSFNGVAKVDDVDLKIQEATQALETCKTMSRKANEIQHQSLLGKFAVPVFPAAIETVIATTLDSVALAAEEKTKAHLTSHAKGLSVAWVKQGFEGQIDTHCPYCGTDMSGSELLDVYKSFFSGELKNLDKARQDIITLINESVGENAQIRFRQNAEKLAADKKWWHDVLGVELPVPDIAVDYYIGKFKKIFQQLMAVIGRKGENLANAISLLPEEEKALQSIHTVIDEIEQLNQGINEANNIIENFKSQVTSVDVSTAQKKVNELQCAKERHSPNVIQAFSSYDVALANLRNAQTAKSQANENLKEQSERVLADYGDRINQILQRFGVEFQIKSEGVNFRGGSPSGQLVLELQNEKVDCSDVAAADPAKRSLANTLSGGDRSALALAYFLAKVESDPNLAMSIVVFDDPYHEQDQSRRSYTVSYIGEIATACEQCFVLSHSIEFAREVEGIKANAGEKRAFQIARYQNPCVLAHGELPILPTKRHLKDYERLSQYALNPVGDEEERRDVAGLIRIVLEGYLKYKYPCPRFWNGASWLGPMVDCIRKAQGGNPIGEMKSLLRDLSTLATFSSPFHHAPAGAAADVPTETELKSMVDATLRIVHHG